MRQMLENDELEHYQEQGYVIPRYRLPDDLDASDLPEEIAQLIPRQLLVVHEDRAQVHLTPSPVRVP